MANKIDLTQVYRPESQDGLRDTYDHWAGAYDDQMVGDFGYVGHELMFAFLRDRLNKDDRILDAGAGSGLVGETLHREGFTHVDASDLSIGMLEQARVRSVYRDVRVAVLGQPLDYADDSYDVAIICGVFTPGHAPPESFVELLRIVRSDGLIAFTLRHDETPPGFLEAIDKHIASGAWRLVVCGDPVATMPAKDQALVHRYWLFQVA